MLTWNQARAYKDLPTLWRDTLAENPGSWIAHHNLALHHMEQGELARALKHFNDAIRAKPRTGTVKCRAFVGSRIAAEALIKFMMVDAEQD